MHKSRLGCVVIDCQHGDLDGHATFWAEALGYEVGERDDRYVVLHGPEREVKVLIQAVEHEPRVHFDIETDDREAERARLEGLGAREVARVREWIVMEAPSGHRFCIVKPQRSDLDEHGAAHG